MLFTFGGNTYERVETFFSLRMWYHAARSTVGHCTETMGIEPYGLGRPFSHHQPLSLLRLQSFFRVIRQAKKIVENDIVDSFYEGGENDTFEDLVFFRKNFIFCRNDTDILLSNEKLEENDPICDDNRMIQVGISYQFYFRLKNEKTGSQPLGKNDANVK